MYKFNSYIVVTFCNGNPSILFFIWNVCFQCTIPRFFHIVYCESLLPVKVIEFHALNCTTQFMYLLLNITLSFSWSKLLWKTLKNRRFDRISLSFFINWEYNWVFVVRKVFFRNIFTIVCLHKIFPLPNYFVCLRK